MPLNPYNAVQRSLLKFENAIKSAATRKLYNHYMKKFLEWAKIKDADGLLQLKMVSCKSY